MVEDADFKVLVMARTPSFRHEHVVDGARSTVSNLDKRRALLAGRFTTGRP
ncbi:hypothetical protein [Phytohabitans suffuscus]|uniref:Uncharacterized protein n=1 Tax=Phytohabitans suffuscus TaxID=624315 RepID=A0A6F8YDQ6_9ACTN|nr:hypothetical protein [Phytohabitans suffuscus]BCB84236.1 hypothetical protein Psuf_015490 [Phytohabitans suffuscus]